MGKGGKRKGEPGKKVPQPGASFPEPASSPAVRTYALLAGIFAAGLALRLFSLARKPLWLDEASTNFLTAQPDLAAVVAAASNDHHAPLHFVIIWLVKMFGSSELVLRFPSAIAGALTIIVIFFIARELYSDEAGLIAATLLALSPYHILYSQEARMYGLAVLFVACAIWMFLRSARTGTLRDWLLFGGSCALAFYTHFYTAFAVIALALAYVVLRSGEFRSAGEPGGSGALPFSLPHDLRHFVTGMALSFVLVLPILSSFFSQSGYFVSRTFNWGIAMGNIPSQTFLMFSLYSDLVAFLFVCLMLGGLALLWNRGRESAGAAAVILFVPMLISMYLSQIIPFNVRYHLYLIVVFLSLVAIPLAWLSGKIHAKYGTAGAIVLLLFLSALPLSAYYTNPLQEDWRTFSANLRQATQPGDIIAPLPWYMYQPLSYYYDNSTDGTYYRNFALDEEGFASLDTATAQVYFVVTWDISAADPTGYSVQYLNNHTTQVQGSVPGIYLLRKTS